MAAVDLPGSRLVGSCPSWALARGLANAALVAHATRGSRRAPRSGSKPSCTISSTRSLPMRRATTRAPRTSTTRSTPRLARWSDARLNLVGPPDPVAARSPHPTSSPPPLLLPGLGWCYHRSSRDSFLIHSPLLLLSHLLFIPSSSSSTYFFTSLSPLLFNFGAYSCARRADLLTRTAAEGHLHY